MSRFLQNLPNFAKICRFLRKCFDFCEIFVDFLRKFADFCEHLPMFAKMFRFLRKFADFGKICRFLRKSDDFCPSVEELEKFCTRTKRFVNLRMLDIFLDHL